MYNAGYPSYAVGYPSLRVDAELEESDHRDVTRSRRELTTSSSTTFNDLQFEAQCNL